MRRSAFLPPNVDTIPNAFSFVDQTGVPLSTAITSASITVLGINSPSPITVTGGTYDKNGSGSFTAVPGTVISGDTVRARVTSSGANSTGVTATVTIGGVSDGFTATTLASGSSIFPLSQSADARYLVTPDLTPRPILGRTSWHLISTPVATYQSYLADTVAKNFNCIEMNAIYHWPGSAMNGIVGAPTPPFGGNGELPFLNRLNGTAWNGALTYSNINAEAPDFTTPNETYWAYLDTLLSYCAAQGIFVLLFPAYWGYNATNQGWQAEIVANGAAKMQTYGAFIANRYKSYQNIVWMLGGDKGTPPNNFTSGELAAEQGLVTGLQSVTGQLSGPHYGAEWEGSAPGGGSIGTDQTTFGGTQTINGVYSWVGETASNGRRAYARSPVRPAYYMEGPYDEEGPDGNNFNPNAIQPIRRFNWAGWLSTIGGYVNGNGFVWPFGSAYAAHLNTLGAQQCAILNAFIISIPWHRLVPDGLGAIGTLVTAGGGVVDTTSYVAAACTLIGDLLVAYIGPGHSGATTFNLAKLSGPITARWLDPTSGNYTAIGSFANVGTQAFTIPGPNSVGANDWVIRFDAPNDTTPDQFAFLDQNNAPLSTQVTSSTITVAGINAPAAITLGSSVGGSGYGYDINTSGSFTAAPGSVVASDTVRVRLTTSPSNSTPAQTTITIGGVQDTFTATTLASGSSLVNHGDTLVITGSGFGTKTGSAPLVWDDCSHGQALSARWTLAWPFNSLAASNTGYRAVQRGVSLPHTHANKYLCGRHNNDGQGLGAYSGYNVLTYKQFTRPASTFFLTASWYARTDPAFVWGIGSPTDDNLKTWAYSGNSEPYDFPAANNYYGCYRANFNLHGTTTQCLNPDNGTTLLNPDVNGHNIFWNEGANENDGWVKHFLQIKSGPDSSCYTREWVNGGAGGVLGVNYQGRNDIIPGDARNFAFGGYCRCYPSTENWRYFLGLALDIQLSHPGAVFITDNANWFSSTKWAYQPHNGPWTNTSIPVLVNLENLTQGSTGYVHIRDEVNGNKQPMTILVGT